MVSERTYGYDDLFDNVNKQDDIVADHMSLPVATAYCKTEIVVSLLMACIDVNIMIHL